MDQRPNISRIVLLVAVLMWCAWTTSACEADPTSDTQDNQRSRASATDAGEVVENSGSDREQDVESIDEPSDSEQPERTHPSEDTAAEDTAASETTDAASGPVLTDTTDNDVDPQSAEEMDIVEPSDSVPVNCLVDSDCALICAAKSWCEEGTCAFEPIEQCVIKTADGAAFRCVENGSLKPDSTCLFCNAQLAPLVWTGTLISDGFEPGEQSELAQQQVLGDDSAIWHHSDIRAAVGNRSLCFGNDGAGSYGVGAQARGRILSAPIEAQAAMDLQLSFQLWLETEETPGFDVLSVVFLFDDNHIVELWNSDEIGGTTHGEFILFSLLGQVEAGQVVQVGFEFDTKDHMMNDFAGPFIDQVILTTTCCTDDSVCDDGNPCTLDSCGQEEGICQHAPEEDCCLSEFDCDDGDPCTQDFCPEAGGSCEGAPVLDCCHSDMDCDDSNPCTADYCPGDGDFCIHQTLCCQDDSECYDQDTCTVDSCADGECLHVNSCCVENAECDDDDYCTTDQCVDGACTHVVQALPGCCSPALYAEDFDSGTLAGWKLDPLHDGVGWQLASMSQALSAPGALYYGNPSNENFTSGSNPNAGTATSIPILLPEAFASSLSLAIFIDTEYGESWDQFSLNLTSSLGTDVLTSKSALTMGGWKILTYDLSYLGGYEVRLVFDFDTVDGSSNDGLGILVDDLEFLTTCEPKECSANSGCKSSDKCLSGTCVDGGCVYSYSCCETDSECDDGQVCTVDSCSNGKCKHSNVSDCCEESSECEDQNPCTIDICTGYGGVCSNETIPECCLQPSDCHDDNTCTFDQCLEQICVHSNVCCASDAECNDGDDVCTFDTCQDGFCSHQPTGAEGCCLPEPIHWDFEIPVNFTVTASSPPCTWQVAAGKEAVSGTQTLNYGDIEAGNYDCGKNSGTALSDPVNLMGGSEYELSFDIYMGTEKAKSFDALWIRAIVDGQIITLWDKGKMESVEAWHSYSVNLTAFAGKTFSFEFEFDSKDSAGNGGDGVFIDNLFVHGTCATMPCDDSSNCDDELEGTTGTCGLDGCLFSIP